MALQLEKLLIELAITSVEKAYLTEANDIYCWLTQLDKKYLESALLIKILILLRQVQIPISPITDSSDIRSSIPISSDHPFQ